jgi:enoyl-CoA hydratase/carnithine racemase
MSGEYLLEDRDGPVTVLTINRPEVMNALHRAAHDELSERIDAFAADPAQQVLVLTGSGRRAFCAGNDLKVTAADGVLTPEPATGFAGLTSRFDLNKPVLAAVNGVAVGGGFETVLACDIVIASASASFALPEPRVGLAAMAGGLLRLPRAIGEKRAMELILTSRRVSAEEGLALGFVNRVVNPDDLLTEAIALAHEICRSGPLSLQASKEVVQKSWSQPLEVAMTAMFDLPAVRALYASDDFREGPKAFAEKRTPNWTGR